MMTPQPEMKTAALQRENEALYRHVRELESRLHALQTELSKPPETQEVTFRAWLGAFVQRTTQRLDGIVFGKNR